MKMLILGAGYVGQACIINWSNPHDLFIATTTNKQRVSELKAITPHVEITFGNDLLKLKNLFDSCDGAIICTAPKDRTKYYQTYFETAETISQILSRRKKPFHLIYTSSTSVYGDHSGKQVDEESKCLAASDNGLILIETEKLYLEANSDDVSTCILRLGGIFGPGRELDNRAKKFSDKEFTGRDIPTNSSHLSTITAGIEWCFKLKLTGIYNLVENLHPTRGELYGGLLQSSNRNPPIWKEPYTGGCMVSNTKIKKTGFLFHRKELNHKVV